jgi:hypothetical protein
MKPLITKESGLDYTSDPQCRVLFEHDGMMIFAPHLSECGRFIVEPKQYGFDIWETGGGCTAWGRKFGPVYMLVTHADDPSHEFEDGRVAVGVYDYEEGNTLVTYILDAGGDVEPGSYQKGD